MTVARVEAVARGPLTKRKGKGINKKTAFRLRLKIVFRRFDDALS